MSHLLKCGVPHNGSSIEGEPFPFRSFGVYPSNLDSLERFIVEGDQVEDVVSRVKAPILIKKYFISRTIIKMNVSQKVVKLDSREKKSNFRQELS